MQGWTNSASACSRSVIYCCATISVFGPCRGRGEVWCRELLPGSRVHIFGAKFSLDSAKGGRLIFEEDGLAISCWQGYD